MNILLLCDYLETNATNTCVWVITQEAISRGHHCVICSFQGCVFDSHIDQEVHIGPLSTNYSDYSFLNRLRDYLSAYRPLWAIKKSVRCKSLRRIVKNQLCQYNPDLIVASLQPIESLVIGQEIKKNYLKSVVYIPYMLDAIFACKPLTGMPKWLYRIIALYREKILFKEAEAVVMMRSAKSEYVGSKIKLSYFSKITFLDIPFYKPVKSVPISDRQFFPKDQKVLFYAGTMPRSIRDPRFFLRAFSLVNNDSIHVYFAGKSGFMEEIEEFMQNDKRIHFLGMLPHEEVIKRVCEADIMLNFGNHFKGMMPSKIFEYISARKPIISTYFIDDDQSNDYLIKYGAALLLDERSDDRRAAEEITLFINDNISAPEFDVLNQLYRDNAPSAFVDFLERIVNV